MSRRPDDVHDLLAADALGALDEDDRALVEELVVADADARVELDGYRAGVALLDVDDVPRPEVWERIEAAIGDDRRVAVVPILHAPSRRRGWAVVAAAAAALLAVTLWGAGQLHNPSPATEAAAALRRVAQQAAGTPGARHLTVTSPDASSIVRVIVLPDGRGFVVGGVLAHAGATYALYATTAGKPVLVAVLGSTLHLVAFQLPRDAVGLVIGVTSGVEQPVQGLATQAIAPCSACSSPAPAAGGGASPGNAASPSPASSTPAPSRPSPPPPTHDAPPSGGANPLLPPLTLPTLPLLPVLHQLLP